MAENYYTNLNNNIRFTDDVSFKLLGLVPLFSGSGMLVAVMRSEYFWSPAIYAIYVAFAVIVGLFALLSIVLPLKIAPVPPST